MGPADTNGSLQLAVHHGGQPVLSTVPPIHLAPREREVSMLEMSSGISITVVIHEPTANRSAALQLRKKWCSAAAATVHAVSVWHLRRMPEQRKVGPDLREV